MKKWSGTLVIVALFSLLVLRYGFMGNPFAERTLLTTFFNISSDHLHWKTDGVALAIRFPENDTLIVLTDYSISGNFTSWNLSVEELNSLKAWKCMFHSINLTNALPHAKEAIKEGCSAWQNLMDSVQEKKHPFSVNGSSRGEARGKQCPYSIRKMNSSELASENGYKLRIPCGLVQGSSITVIGTPAGLLGNFQFDLRGMTLPGELDPPIILHYNVRLHGDKLTEDPVIVQNTWTAAHDWGEEERCPSDSNVNKKVDDLEKCSKFVGKDDKRRIFSGEHYNGSRDSPKPKSGERSYFPFQRGYLSIATLRVGEEGIQMTVDGKHITSFPYRESLEPWLVSEIRILGDIKVISVLASGLPTSEDIDHVIDLEGLKSPPLPLHKHLDLFVGIFSSANNFKRRMAIRRTWFQYDAVQSGAAAAHFFVGLHKNQMVNAELWNEAQTYGDIQLMPFVDYYSLISWKTIAICTYATNVVSADYIMKTDDDSFVRVDEVMLSLKGADRTHGLLYGLINSESKPHRSTDSKWYITPEEWTADTYPPWAHGPGYVVSHDIANAVYKQHKKGSLRMFKLEDVAMGIWIADMKKRGKKVKYVHDGRIHTEGCETGYVVAHYQGPRDMLCLWQKLQDTHVARCCADK